jgi:hypothetical protein
MPDRFSSARWQLVGVMLNRDARWIGPHLWRFAFLVVLFLGLWSASSSILNRTAPGLEILKSLTSWSAFGLIALATAGVGSLFRDEWLGNNLELVQLTGISGFDLLVAKLIPLWLTGLSLLFLEIPVFLLCVTLGGVTPIQVAAVIGQLLWLFMVASSVTVMTAALFRRPLTIVICALVLFFFYCVATWLFIDLAIIIVTSSWTPAGGTMPRRGVGGSNVAAVNWFAEFDRIFTSGFSGPVLSWPALVHLAAMGVFLYSASRTLKERMSRPREEISVEETAPEGTAHQSLIPVWRPNYRIPTIVGHPIEWKDYHFTLGGDEMMTGKWGLILLGIAFVTIIGVPMVMAADGARGDFGPCLALIMIFAVVAPLANMVHMANRLWLQEIRERTLESLIILPISAKDIIHAKLRTFARMCAPETVLYLAEFGVILAASWLSGAWEMCWTFLGLMLSIPMIVCTDAAWRLIPRTWDGLAPRGLLAGSVLSAWMICIVFSVFGLPVIGLTLLGGLAVVISRLAINIAADALGNRAGELVD